jgi:hypothetical protein
MNRKFDYDDINLIPRYSTVDSRQECDTSVVIGKYTFKNPVIPANMESVINEDLAKILAKSNYFYIMHRFNIDIKQFIINMKNENLITSISIGVNQDSYDLLDDLIKCDLIPDYITVDIAHGHCKKMKHMMKYLKENYKDTFIIAGNVSSIEGTIDLDNWGADAIKVGVGPGCFVPDSKVLTLNGYKKIIDIDKNDYVLTHKNRFKKVLEKHIYIEKESLIKINDLPPCTETHEFYVINKKDKLIVNEENIENYAYWIKAEDLSKEKHLLIKY